MASYVSYLADGDDVGVLCCSCCFLESSTKPCTCACSSFWCASSSRMKRAYLSRRVFTLHIQEKRSRKEREEVSEAAR